MSVLLPAPALPVPPVPPVAPDAPEPPDPEPVESPTARPTLATVPDIAARRVAPSRAARASASWLRALARWALAAARDSEVEALSTWSCAAVTSAAASVTASRRSLSSIVASTWPFVTVSPTSTSTAVTVPDEVNDAVEVFAGETVPDAETVSLTVPSEAATSAVLVVVAAVGLAAARLLHHHPPTAPAATSTTAARAPRARRRQGVDEREAVVTGGTLGTLPFGTPSGPCARPVRTACAQVSPGPPRSAGSAGMTGNAVGPRVY